MAAQFKKDELLRLVREAKKNNLTCSGYSKMRKQELYDHVVRLGLIPGAEGPGVAPCCTSESLGNRPEQLKANVIEVGRKAEELSFTTLKGNAKKSSFLRRVARVLAMPELDEAIVEKVTADYNKLSSYG
jgi:hypothetical protein